MAIVLVVAMDSKGCIGKDGGGLPWGAPIPADMRSFRAITLEEVVVMGRKTWQSIDSKPLKERTNVVLTRDKNFLLDGDAIAVYDPENIRVFAKLLRAMSKDIFIIGGAEIYKEFYPDASRISVTVVNGDFGGDYGDAYFPSHNSREWKQVSHRAQKKDVTTPFDLEFVTLERILPPV